MGYFLLGFFFFFFYSFLYILFSLYPLIHPAAAICPVSFYLSLCVYSSSSSSSCSFIFCCDVTSKENASTGLQEITRRKQKKRRDGIPLLPFRQPLRCSRRSSCGEYCTSFFFFSTFSLLRL